jgi:hypothetical protein
MLSRISSIIRKEFIHVIRDPRTLAIVLAMPARSSCCLATRSTPLSITCP